MRAVKYQGIRNMRIQLHEAEMRNNANGTSSSTKGQANALVQNILANIMRAVCSRRPMDEETHVVTVKNTGGKSVVSFFHSLTI